MFIIEYIIETQDKIYKNILSEGFKSGFVINTNKDHAVIIVSDTYFIILNFMPIGVSGLVV